MYLGIKVQRKRTGCPNCVLDKVVKQNVCNGHWIWIDEKAVKAEAAASKGYIKEVYHITKLLPNTGLIVTVQLRIKRGTSNNWKRAVTKMERVH